jgi:hypothetical protein
MQTQRLKPVPFRLSAGSEAEKRFKKYLEDRVESLRRGLERLHGMDGIIKWRKAYEAVPAESVREFPWHNASNLVVPIIAIHSDTLLARVMSAVMKTSPLWVVRELGEFAKQAPEGLRDALEEFLQYVGLEPAELDLYRVYHEWFGETIRLGTGVLKAPWVKEFEDKYGPAGDASGSGANGWYREVTYEGPRPEKLKFENFKCPVDAATIEAMDFKYDIVQMSRLRLEERKLNGVYDSVAVQYVLAQPDRTSRTTQVQSQKEQDANVHTVPGYGWAEWDICECHFKYRVDATHFARLIVHYHEKSKQVLRSYYHYYPGEIYVAARLFYRDDMFHGMGFGEILLPFQEEISEIHNQRRDNMTVANTKMFAVDPDSKLHKGYRTFPSAMLPAKQMQGNPEISTLEFGTPVQGEIDSERLSLELAEKRSGVSPPMQGAGAGSNSKRGVYTAMGTLSLMQDGNTRTDLNITDIRYAHTRLGRLLCHEYGTFGPNDRLLEMFGTASSKIEAALQAIVDRKMALPVYASSASVNREVEKQSSLMLTQVMDRYHQNIAAMLQGLSNPLVPEPIKQYTGEAMKAARMLMTQVLRLFGEDEVDRLLPQIPDSKAGQPPAAAGGPGQPQLPAGGQPQGTPDAGASGAGMVPPTVMPQGGPKGVM